MNDREPLPLRVLAYGLVVFALFSLSLDSMFKSHLAWQIFLFPLYQAVQQLASFAFIVIGIALEILTFRYFARWGYIGVVISLVAFLVVAYFLIAYLGV